MNAQFIKFDQLIKEEIKSSCSPGTDPLTFEWRCAGTVQNSFTPRDANYRFSFADVILALRSRFLQSQQYIETK